MKNCVNFFLLKNVPHKVRLTDITLNNKHIFRSFQRRWGDYSISQDYSRSQLHSVCGVEQRVCNH